MKILYGVQGTGNGHITRSRIMAQELKKAGHEVQFLFSGRAQSKYFDMEAFGNPIFRKGLTFDIRNGKVNYFRTLFKNNLITFLKDVKTLDVSQYDLVISDFEPITAWAAKRQGKECIGIGHQYAFDYNIPISHSNFIAKKVMKYFAPVDKGIGLHWDNFDQPIMPPIIETEFVFDGDGDKILVYLPFENKNELIDLFLQYPEYEFILYGFHEEFEIENVECKLPSLGEFQNDLMYCGGVICNAGFELASEALLLGRKLLVKPVHGQMEQHSNAKALTELDFGIAVNEITYWELNKWLRLKTAVRINYPNVAAYIVDWLGTDRSQLPKKDIWNSVQIERTGL